MRRHLASVLLLGLVTACSPDPTVIPATQAPVTAPTTNATSNGFARTLGGHCHARQVGNNPLLVLPDSACTPGAVNPAVTQANIKTTVCKSGWTNTVRPDRKITDALKKQGLIDYGLTGPLSTYEEDHLISLELGGSPSDPKNLWPEPNYPNGPSPTGYDHNPKDPVEFALRNAVCAKNPKITLAQAQAAIATDWTTARTRLGLR